MKHQFIRIALLSNSPTCHQRVKAICASQDWRVLNNVDHAQPQTWLQQQRIDLALIDLDYPNAIDIINTSSKLSPNLPIVAIARQERFLELQQAILAGAAGFVISPIDQNQFVVTIGSLLSTRKISAENHTKALMVAVTSLKGGVGKSTIATNLAVTMHQLTGMDVILVEAHHGVSDLSLMLNLHPTHHLGALLNDNGIDEDLVRGILQKHNSGIHFLSAPTNVTELVELTPEIWRELFGILTEIAPIVIADTAPIADFALEETLNMSDVALVVSSPEMPSLRHAVNLIAAIRNNEEMMVEPRLILNRVGMPGSVKEKDIRSKLGEPVAASLPDDPALTTFALNRGVPFVLSHPRAKLSQAFKELATALVRMEEEPVEARQAVPAARETAAPGGFFARFRHAPA